MENNMYPPRPRRKPHFLLIVIIILLVLALIFVAATALKKNKSSQPQNTQNTQNIESTTTTANLNKTLVEPLGTGKYSLTGPMQGGAYFCQSIKKSQTGIGAQVAGPWTDKANGVWYPLARAVVDGAKSWPDGYVRFTVNGDIRKIETNNTPLDNPAHDDTTGNFPIAKTDDAYQYDRNPNPVEAKSITWEIPANPKVAATPTCLALQSVGYGINGITFFAANDGQNRDPAYETSDACQGHPGPQHVYHYHIVAGSPCLGLADSQNPDKQSKLIGYALDGFGIYSQYENGKELFTKDLDECHGKTSQVMWNGSMVNMYHYVVTRDYPYTLGCFKGSPIDSPTNRQTRQSLNIPQLGK